jgi:hypothetical protein
VGKKGEEFDLIINDLLGNKVYETSGTNTDYDNHLMVNLPVLSSGVYVVKLKSANLQLQRKIVVK